MKVVIAVKVVKVRVKVIKKIKIIHRVKVNLEEIFQEVLRIL
jgi:hypothetical protein